MTLTKAGNPRKRPARAGEGRPPTYEDSLEAVARMQANADAYFKRCDGYPLLDQDGQPQLDRQGNAIRLESEPYTITGLALALGFNSRVSLLDYDGGKDYIYSSQFMSTISHAKAKVEAYAERRLYDKDGSQGARFNLSNNFKRWTEKTSTEITGRLDQGLTDADRALLTKVNARLEATDAKRIE